MMPKATKPPLSAAISFKTVPTPYSVQFDVVRSGGTTNQADKMYVQIQAESAASVVTPVSWDDQKRIDGHTDVITWSSHATRITAYPVSDPSATGVQVGPTIEYVF